MAAMRDHYDGTPYSSAAGLAAGAWGNPNRYGGGAFAIGTGVHGAWERTISIHRSTVSDTESYMWVGLIDCVMC
jgi:hypothetical protein